MKLGLIVTVAILSFTATCQANDKPIDEMFAVMQMDKQLTGGFEAMLPIIEQMAAKFNLDAAAKQELEDIYRTWFEQDIDKAKMLSSIKTLYRDAFSDEEIKQVTAFYRTEVGQKFLMRSPQLMQLGAKIGMREAQAKQAQLMVRLKPFMAKYGIN